MPTQKPVVLKLGGKVFNPRPLRPSIAKLIAYLDSCPIDEIFRHDEVPEKLGLSPSYFKDNATDPALQPYTAKVSGQRYAGNPKAIAELKRQTGGER